MAFIIVLPMPLYGSRYIFSKPFFRLWVVWTFAWAWAAGLVITLLPLWQGRHTLKLVLSHTFQFPGSSQKLDNSVRESEVLETDSRDEDEKKNSEPSIFPVASL